MGTDDYIGAGEYCWIRTVGTDACGHYLHTEASCRNILFHPGTPKRYALAEWAGRKPQCPVCKGIAEDRMLERARSEVLQPAGLPRDRNVPKRVAVPKEQP